jgi:hypothetical protein
MALAGALCTLVHTITGVTNRSLRAQVATLLGVPYSARQMSYDLRRLRLKGLITRLPHTDTYVLTPEGSESRSSTPKSTTGSSGRCWRPMTRPHPWPCDKPYG